MSGPKMIAHRGAGDLIMPEASLAAYSNAVATASDIVKLDIQFTKDGVAVMSHDNSLKRCMDWDVQIADLTYGEILAKGRYLENGRPGEMRIVRLDEALAVVKSVPEFWIDFKNTGGFVPEQADKVVESLNAAGVDLGRVMVATFTRRALAYFKERYPKVRRVGHFSFSRKVGDKAGGAPIVDALAFAREYGLYGLNMPVRTRQTRLEDIVELKRAGLWVSLWFVQDGEAADYYWSSGADAFVTDHVSAVRARKR